MNPDEGIRRELARKTFHLLTFLYLAAFRLLGFPRVVPWMAAWAALVGAVEFARLRVPAVNRLFVLSFSRIIRAEEHRRMSGVYYSALGALCTVALFGRSPSAVSAGLVCLTLGDAAAAVVGKTWGRVRLPWAAKTAEGSAACMAACFAGSAAFGVPAAASAVSAVAAAAVESAPMPFDDNLWIPLAGAAAAWLVC